MEKGTVHLWLYGVNAAAAARRANRRSRRRSSSSSRVPAPLPPLIFGTASKTNHTLHGKTRDRQWSHHHRWDCVARRRNPRLIDDIEVRDAKEGESLRLEKELTRPKETEKAKKDRHGPEGNRRNSRRRWCSSDSRRGGHNGNKTGTW